MGIYTAEEITEITIPETIPEAALKAVLNTVCRGAPILAGYGLLTGNLPAIAFGTGGSIACGIPLFPYDPPPPPVYIPFNGGQCLTDYFVVARGRWRRGDGLVVDRQSPEFILPGPIGGLVLESAPIGGGVTALRVFCVYGPNRNRIQVLGVNSQAPPNDVVWEYYEFARLARVDGLADNCGDPPTVRPPLLPPFEEPPGWPDAPRIPGFETDIPYKPPGLPPSTPPWRVPFKIPDIPLPVIIPIRPEINFNITAPINIAVEIPFTLAPEFNGTLNVQIGPGGEFRTPPDLIDECEECVCPPVVECPITTAFRIPYFVCSGDTGPKVATLEVVSSSIPPGLDELLLASAILARTGCESENPEQKDPSLLFSGSSGPILVQPIITGELPEEVVSIELRITSFSPTQHREITTFPGAGQRKFGAISYLISGQQGGSDQLYIWDTSTYMRLPRRLKPLRLKVILRESISFQIWDTGERTR